MKRSSKKWVRALSNGELLEEYTSLQRRAGDDFSVVQFGDEQEKRADACRKEILKRMASAA